jgi:hypothetical protein
MREFIYFLLCLFITGQQACSLAIPKEKKVESPPGYNFTEPETIRLPEELDEISGMAYDAQANRILALNDEEGRIYEIIPGREGKFRNSKFMKGGDFEDLCLVGEDLWALKSNGQLVLIRKPLTDSQQTEKFSFSARGPVDFETLFYLPQAGQLVILCKECRDFPGEVPGFSFDINARRFSDSPAFRLDFSGIPEKERPDKKQSLKPSGAAFHPLTGELFVLASANRRLVVTDSNGYAKKVYVLDQKTFKQPEGICFSPGGDLYISNEARAGTANIRKFTYKPVP